LRVPLLWQHYPRPHFDLLQPPTCFLFFSGSVSMLGCGFFHIFISGATSSPARPIFTFWLDFFFFFLDGPFFFFYTSTFPSFSVRDSFGDSFSMWNLPLLSRCGQIFFFFSFRVFRFVLLPYLRFDRDNLYPPPPPRCSNCFVFFRGRDLFFARLGVSSPPTAL